VQNHDGTASANHGYSIHDSFGRVLRQGTFLLGGAESVVDIEYDEMGRKASQSAPHFIAATSHTTRFSYDAIGRVTEIEQPVGDESPGTRASTTYTYNGRDTTITDVRANDTVYRRNAAGQTIQVTDAASTATTYTYYPFGELKTVTIGSNVTTVTYDAAGRKASLDDPDLGTWSYTHNAFGELINQVDAAGNEVDLTYDLLGRLTSRVDTDTSNNPFTTTWTYDPDGCKGYVDQIADGNNYSEAYSYDTYCRSDDVLRTVDGIDYQFTSTFDSYGRLATLQYPESVTPDLSNDPPSADAGSDQSVTEFDLVTLNGSGSSDPDAGPQSLAYNWSQISGPAMTLSSTTSASPTFTAIGSGTAQFQLAVSDGAATAIDWVDVVIADVAPPASITPSETSDTDGAYTISWSAGTLATTYALQEQVDGGAWTTLSSSLTVTYDDLTSQGDGVYHYRVAACRSGGCTDYTTTTTPVTVVHPAATPGSITVPAGDDDGDFTIAWTAGGGTVDSFDLQEREAGGAWGTVYAGAALSTALTGRAMASEYEYQVRACNTTDCSSYLAGANSLVTLAGVPASITLPSTVPSGGDISISWAAVSGVVDAYELQEQVDGGGWNATPIYSGTSLAYVAEDRTETSTYEYRVRACNAAGCDDWREGSHAVEGLVAPTSVSINAPTFDADGTFTVSWSASGTVTNYTLERRL